MTGIYHCREANLGDRLGPLLLQTHGLTPAWTPARDADYVGIGSILAQCGGTAATLLGAGYIARGERSDLSRVARGVVRGALSQRQGDLPADFPLGDLGIVMPEVLGIAMSGGGGTVLVPHYIDRALPARYPGVPVVDVRGAPRRIIEQIAQADWVVTSSLHGMVIADALGIEHRVEMHPGVIGGPFKFEDYLSAFGLSFAPGQWRLTPRSAMVARVGELRRLVREWVRG